MSSTNPRRRVLRRPEVEQRVGLARSTIYHLISLGQFPTPIKLGAKSVGWIEGEIDGWLESRLRKGEEVQA
ncbi:MAG: AlpA family transcriptional regulator [Methylococcus sp.]|nr:MAG: AlpA family transcriptional regulator [Methylococcus sp.]